MALALGKRNREPDVQPHTGRLGAFASSLTAKYSSASSEAAKKVCEAEACLFKENADGALKAAQGAAEAFKGDPAGLADAVHLLAHVLCCAGKFAEAEEAAKAELTKYRDSGDKTGEAKMMLAMAEVHKSTGDGETALADASEAVRILRGQGDKTMVAAGQLVLASVCLEKKGDLKKRADEAKQACDEALPVFREGGVATSEAYALHVTACSRALSGATEGAIRAAKEAQNLYVKAEFGKQAAYELHCIAKWHLKEGEVDDAVAAAQEALDIFEDDLKGTDSEAAAMQTLIQAYLERKEGKDALKLAKYELDRFQESGNLMGVAAAQEMVMLAYFAMGNADRAMRYAQRAADTLEQLNDKKNQGKVLRTMCTLHRARADYEKALKTAQEALTIFEDLEDTKEQAMTIQARADVYLEKKENDRALALSAEARELYSDAKYVEGEVSALLQLATAQFAGGDLKKAAASAREAQDKSTEVADQDGEASALRMLTEVYVCEKEFDAALRVLGSLLTLVKEMGDKDEEVSVMVLTCRAMIMQIMQKEEEGKSNEKMFKAAADKSTKLAKDALAAAKKCDSPQVLGCAHFTMSQANLMNGKAAEAIKEAENAQSVFKGCSYTEGEAASFVLLADVYLFNRDLAKARELGEEGVYLFQSVGDADGEDMAWTELERVEKIEGEIREQQAREQAMRDQWQMNQWQMQQGGQQWAPQESYEEAAPSAAGGGYEAKLMKLDVGSGLDPAQLKSQILEVTKGLIGYDEDIEYDMPLMESGLTSNTAVLLRDALTQQLPGVNMPVTLVFDYPSISAMSDLIVENAARAAKKAKKALG